jgi:cysteine desulfurase
MAVNNETGVIQPWEAIRDLTKELSVRFFSDTTQLIGRMPFHFNESGLDWAMASGHKLGALPGSGFLLARDPGALRPLVWGGGQESGLRGGTQNYLGVETLAVALQTLPAKLARIPQLNAWRNNLEAGLPSGTVVIGAKHERLPGTMLIGCPGVHGQGVQIELESQDIFVTTSAACSDNEPATSKVLRAMKIDDILGRSVIRASLSLSASESDYQTLLASLKTAYAKLNRIKAY